MMIEIIKALVAVAALIAYALWELNALLGERRLVKRAERERMRLGCKQCRDMYRSWTRGKFDESADGEVDKHLNVICKNTAIAPAFE